MEHVITMCMWRRPKYSAEVLKAMLKCEGIEKYRILVHLDGPVQAKMMWLIQRFQHRFPRIEAVVNEQHIGCNENTRQALAHGFELSDYVIHIEDDVLPAPDALRFLEWARTQPRDDNLYQATMWRHPEGWIDRLGGTKPPGNDGKAKLSNGLWIWGWATWKDRWEVIKSCWTASGDFDGAGYSASWDTWLCDHLPHPVVNIAPLTSRSVNIGLELGTHGGDFPLEYWAGDPRFERPENYELI